MKSLHGFTRALAVARSLIIASAALVSAAASAPAGFHRKVPGLPTTA